jgi:hypothetical protein
MQAGRFALVDTTVVARRKPDMKLDHIPFRGIDIALIIISEYREVSIKESSINLQPA